MVHLCSYPMTRCNPALNDCPNGDTCNEYPLHTTLEFVDGAVTNNMAWDYAVVSRDRSLNESAMSETALAILLSRPRISGNALR